MNRQPHIPHHTKHTNDKQKTYTNESINADIQRHTKSLTDRYTDMQIEAQFRIAH